MKTLLNIRKKLHTIFYPRKHFLNPYLKLNKNYDWRYHQFKITSTKCYHLISYWDWSDPSSNHKMQKTYELCFRITLCSCRYECKYCSWVWLHLDVLWTQFEEGTKILTRLHSLGKVHIEIYLSWYCEWYVYQYPEFSSLRFRIMFLSSKSGQNHILTELLELIDHCTN